MEFLEQLKKTVTSVAKVSGRESKKLYAVTKLKLEITEKKNREKALFKEIGFDAYKAYRNGKSVTKRIRAKLEEVDAIEDAFEILSSRIELIKNTDEFEGEEFAEEIFDEVYEEAEVLDDEEETDDSEEESVDDEEDPETEPIDPIE